MNRHFYKTWFTFPFCIDINDCVTRVDYKTKISFHILWWHFKWYVKKRM